MKIFKYLSLSFLIICTLFLIFCIGLAVFDKEEIYTNGDQKVKYAGGKWLGYSKDENKWKEYKDIEKLNDDLWLIKLESSTLGDLFLKRFDDRIEFKPSKEEISILGKNVTVTLYKKE